MKIDEILKNSLNSEIRQEVYTISGLITTDTDDETFRLYRNPLNKRSYWVIKRSDVIGEIHQWSAEEKVHAGLVGEEMYNIQLPHCCEVRTVEITIEKLGETLAGDDIPYSAEKQLKGRCRPSSGCGSRPCCTEHARGCRCNNCCVG